MIKDNAHHQEILDTDARFFRALLTHDLGTLEELLAADFLIVDVNAGGLTNRADFLAAATGIKIPAAAFVLQAKRRGDQGPARFGFTVSKKVGNAVERNRVRRRLREIVRLNGATRVQAGHDYVLVGRRAALALPFERIRQDFDGAIRRAHRH